MKISVSPLIKHLCGKLILFCPTLKLVPTPIQFRIRCLNQRCMITFFSRFLLDNDRNEKKYYKSIDKNKYCPYLFFFISDCCLFKIKRNNRISFISNIIEKKKNFECIYRFLILTAVFVFKIFFQFKLNEKVYVSNPVSNFFNQIIYFFNNSEHFDTSLCVSTYLVYFNTFCKSYSGIYIYFNIIFEFCFCIFLTFLTNTSVVSYKEYGLINEDFLHKTI